MKGLHPLPHYNAGEAEMAVCGKKLYYLYRASAEQARQGFRHF